jgi:hypothetical protein
VALPSAIDMAELARLRAAAAAQRQRELGALIAGLADKEARFEPSAEGAAEAAVAAQQRARECRRNAGLAHDRAAWAHDRAASVAMRKGDLDRAAHHRDQADSARLAAARDRVDLTTYR